MSLLGVADAGLSSVAAVAAAVVETLHARATFITVRVTQASLELALKWRTNVHNC